MPFRVKVDEDLPTTITQMLNAAGYDVASVFGQGMGGWKDPPLWQAVQAESRFLVTVDKGFGDIRSYPPGTHAGVLVLRPDEDGIRPVVELTQQVLAQYPLNDLAGTITVATPRGIRIRRPPNMGEAQEEQADDV
jgi:predicted nuclease of predicted toxin-antitoxin system